ncbi:MAG TPA: hypothetical protein VFA83_18960 [Acidimicrobiales bacterium]|nr:hypothetical protein [Acidimicrobiales bacterium]
MDAATPVSSITTPTVIVSAVTPGALAVLPAVEFDAVVVVFPEAAVVAGAAVVTGGLDFLLLLHAAPTTASTAITAAVRR